MSGVLSSWEIWCRKRFFSCSTSSRRVRIQLSRSPSCSRSRGPTIVTALEKSPSPRRRMARSSCRNGRVIRKVNTAASSSAPGTSAIACNTSLRCRRSPNSSRRSTSPSTSLRLSISILRASRDSAPNPSTAVAVSMASGRKLIRTSLMLSSTPRIRSRR